MENPQILILQYHHVNSTVASAYNVPPENFLQQMKYLYENGYHTITLDDYYKYRTHKRQLPPQPVIITFDDGYMDNYLNAYPILQKYGLKATIFATTNNVGRQGFVTWDVMKEMISGDLIRIGSHTLSHTYLTQLTADQAYNELLTSRLLIQEKTGAKVNFFAYPYGDYNQSVADLVAKAGYLGAVISNNRNCVDRESNLFMLKRYSITGTYDMGNFATILRTYYPEEKRRLE